MYVTKRWVLNQTKEVLSEPQLTIAVVEANLPKEVYKTERRNPSLEKY